MIESTVRKFPDGTGIPICRSARLVESNVYQPLDSPLEIPVRYVTTDGKIVVKTIKDDNISVAQFIYDPIKGFYHSVFPYQESNSDFSSGY